MTPSLDLAPSWMTKMSKLLIPSISSLDFRAHDELKGLKKQKKQIKKLAKGYDAFLASSNLIKQVPRLIGPILNKIGKFPVSVPSGAGNVESKVADLKNTVKFALKFK